MMDDLWVTAKAAGVFGALIMLTLYWRSERERLKLQSERDALLREVVTVIASATSAVTAVTGGFANVMTTVQSVQATLLRVEQELARKEERERR